MKYLPHNYQEYCTDFIEENPVSALLLDMGLGKTVITLTAINDLLFDSFQVHKILIVAPLRVAKSTWPSEIKKFDHLSSLRYSVAIGTEEERIKALKSKADIYIINRENIPWLVEKSRLPLDYDMLVIDELSSFKNGRAKRFQSILKLRVYCNRCVGLTGSPASSKGLLDLWAEYRVLDLGKRLGRFITHYRDAYFRPDKRNGQIVFSYKPLPFAEETIYEKISDITISMRAEDHLKMPKLISSEYKVYLSEGERKVYEDLKNDYVAEIDENEITVANAAVLTNKLLQLANGAVYDDAGNVNYIHNQKLDALEDIIESANGKPFLLAYWFRHDLERIKKKLDELGVVYASIDSETDIKRWNNKELEVGLIHPASAGHGLNLQNGGNHIVWFSVPFSLELYEQANCRLYRQGQSSETVVIQHLITEGTIDEQVLVALKKKDLTQSALIDAVKANIHGGKKHDSKRIS